MPVTNNLTASSVRKFFPNKVITGTAQSIQNLSSWLYNDGMGDPWWQGAGANPYQWILTANVDTVYHSSYLTRVQFQYTGLDIEPNMWVMGSNNNVLKVISITSMTDSSIVCVIEDVDRYNTMADTSQSGNGVFNLYDNLIFFELGDDGLPVLDPLPVGTDPFVVSQVEDRFRVFNPTAEELFFQINHGFEEGQILVMDTSTGLFQEATSSDIYIVGTVTAVGPGPNYFYLSPISKLINNLEPGLPGSAGNIISLDPTSGDLTAGNGTAVYIQMTNAVPSFSISSIANPTTSSGNQIKLNNVIITLNDNSGTVSSSDLITQINAYTANHGVVASMGPQANTVVGTVKYATSTPSGGVIEFSINGATMTAEQPSIVFGQGTELAYWDLIKVINEQTFITGVYATFNGGTGYVTLQNASGGPIDFVNINPSTTSGSSMTASDMLGFATSNPSGPSNYLTLTRPDGGEIIISDIQGTTTTDVGILSSGNGELPLALVIDSSMYSSGNYVVANDAARDALANIRVGDQVFVQSDTNGEWAMYVYTTSGWIKTADQASANTDANDLEVIITTSSPTSQSIGLVSLNSRILNVTVTVTEPFTSDASITVGTASDDTAIMDTTGVDLTTDGTYLISSAFVYDDTQTDFNVYVYFTVGSATSGSATIQVSYL
jgi:hypothetical protein